MKSKDSLSFYLVSIIIAALIFLFCPIMYMKIGPLGKLHYGPDVPDIYILGGYILGKDTSWWGINFAYKFQLGMVLLYLSLAFLCYKRRKKNKFIFYVIFGMSFLLLLFPLWMSYYTSGVINNSDAADLAVYPHIGWLVYGILVIFHVLIFITLFKKERLLTKYS